MRHADKSCEVETAHVESVRELTETELATVCAGAGPEGQAPMGGQTPMGGLDSLGGLGQLLNLNQLIGGLGGLGGGLGGGGGL